VTTALKGCRGPADVEHMDFAQIVTEVRAFVAAEQRPLDDDALDHQLRVSIRFVDGISQEFLTSAWIQLSTRASDDAATGLTDAEREQLRRHRLGLGVAIIAKALRDPALASRP
jgi:hypothetical protein